MGPSPIRSTEPRFSKRTKVIAGTLAAILLTGVVLMAVVLGVANRGRFAFPETRRQKIVNDLKALGQEMHKNPVR